MGDDVDGLLDELDGMLKEEKPSAINERDGSSYGGTVKTGSSSSGCSGFGRVMAAKPVADKGVGRATAAKPAVDSDIDSLLADLDSSPQRAAKHTRAPPAAAARSAVSSATSVGVAAGSSSSCWALPVGCRTHRVAPPQLTHSVQPPPPPPPSCLPPLQHATPRPGRRRRPRCAA
jgi:hypothetical protein